MLFLLNVYFYLLVYGSGQCIPSEYVPHESAEYLTYVLINHQKGGIEWEEAQSYCQNCLGTSLATILSQEDNSNVTGLLDEFKSTANTENNWWVGWRDYEQDSLEKHFIWAPCDYTNCKSQTLWDCVATDEVNGDVFPHESEGTIDSNKCGVILASSHKWMDKNCANSFDFICNAQGNFPKLIDKSSTIRYVKNKNTKTHTYMSRIQKLS